MSLKEIVGTKIERVALDPGFQAVTFTTDKGTFRYVATGDCCSESWIASFEDFAELEGQTVLRVDERDEVSRDWDASKDMEEHRQECVVVYGYDIVTNKRSFYLDFRNASNGYYGGWLELVK